MSENDAMLLRRLARVGDTEAFAAIVRQYAGFVFGTCRRVLGNESAASDAAQETFFYLLKNANRVTGSLGGWLHRVAVNRSRDLLRADVARRKREAAYSAQTWRETDRWDDIAPAVDEGLESLPPEERELLMRHFLQGQSMVQIAAMHGVSQPTVSRRVADALEHLRAELRQRGLLVGVAVLGATLPQATEAAPELLLQGLGKMVLGQAAATSAAGTGGIAAKISSAVAAATSASLKVKVAACVLVAVAGTSAVMVHRATHTPPNSPAQVDAGPAASDATPAPDGARSLVGSSPESAGNAEGAAGFADNRDTAPASAAMERVKEPAFGTKVLDSRGRYTGGGASDVQGSVATNFSVHLMGSSTGGSAFTNFSFRVQREIGDGTGGGKTVISGGGSGGAYGGFGGRGSVMRLAGLAEVQEELGLTAGQRDAIKVVVERVRAFEDAMRSELRQIPIRERGPVMASRFAEAEQEVARAREEISILLTPTQARRLEQISLQDSGATALFRPDITQALGLTPEQQQRLAEIQDQAGEEAAAMHGVTMHGSGDPPRTNAAPQSFREIMERAERRMLEEVPMAWQQAKLKELQGAPFAFPANYQPPRGMAGFGGGAGGGFSGGRLR